MFLKKCHNLVVIAVFSSILQSLHIPPLSCMESRDKFFLDLALKDPVVTLDEICSVALAAKSGFDAAAFSYDSLKTVVSESEVNCPIFLLGEYMNRCLLSRTIIEEIVSSLLGKLNDIKDRPVEYADFGAKGYFMDFIIAVKVLSQKPDANLSIHLIDSNFTDYVSCRALFGSSHAIAQDDAPCFVKAMFSSVEFSKEHLGSEYPYSAKNDQTLLKNCFMIKEGARQFVSFFKRMFPHAHLSLCLHENIHGYLEYITRQKINPADVTDTSELSECALLEKLTLH